MAKSGPKLTDKQRDQVYQKYIDGYKDKEIMDFCESEFGKTITYQTASYYRKQWADDIQQAEEEKIKEVKTIGYCRISERIKAIEKIIERQVQEFENTKGYESRHTRILNDLVKSIGMMQNHLKENEGKITTPNGTQIVTTIIPALSEEDPISDE